MSKSTRAGPFTSEMRFKNHLDSIKATLVDYPTITQLAKYIPEFVSITWLEEHDQLFEYAMLKGMTRRDFVLEMFAGRTLPTALETVRLTFFLEGLDLTNVTHIIRHRAFSFSAQSSDPTSMEGHDILENDAFLEHPDLAERARNLCVWANELYKAALDRGLTYYDARHYQPRAKEAKYFMSGNLRDWLSFLSVRLGRQNQPTSDNILAARIRAEILKVYPTLNIPAESVQNVYLNNINEKMNLNTYPPDKLHTMELNRRETTHYNVEFNHPFARDQYSCNNHFETLFKEITE